MPGAVVVFFTVAGVEGFEVAERVALPGEHGGVTLVINRCINR